MLIIVILCLGKTDNNWGKVTILFFLVKQQKNSICRQFWNLSQKCKTLFYVWCSTKMSPVTLNGGCREVKLSCHVMSIKCHAIATDHWRAVWRFIIWVDQVGLLCLLELEQQHSVSAQTLKPLGSPEDKTLWPNLLIMIVNLRLRIS